MSLPLLQQPRVGQIPTSRRVSRRMAPPKASQLDKLAATSTTKARVLEMADEELRSLCSSKATPQEQQQCWEVWKFYHDRRQQAAEACEAELSHGASGSSCDQLDTLERLVYEVAFSGDPEQLYHVLRTQSNMAKRAAAAASVPPGDTASPPQDARAALLEAQQARARDLFARADADGNGRLDREEFLAAMRLLQHALSDSEMQLALSCMDSHGYLTPEQFAGIVQAEQMCDTESDAEMLRHVPHARPSWWSDAPHCVTDV